MTQNLFESVRRWPFAICQNKSRIFEQKSRGKMFVKLTPGKTIFKLTVLDANWGSSTQSQTFLTALRGIHNLSKLEEHVKNYRPKVSNQNVTVIP
jgi:hypothetical protein